MNPALLTSAVDGSGTDEWPSPRDLVQALADELAGGEWDLDPCCRPESACANRYYSLPQDGLAMPWTARSVWLNPPYSDLRAWLARAWFAVRGGETDLVCALIPARTDTRAWHAYVGHADEVRLIRGRLRFGKAENVAPFPSAIVIWRAGCSGPPRYVHWTLPDSSGQLALEV